MMVPGKLLCLLFLIFTSGCTTSTVAGHYRIDRVKDGLGNMICFPHTEIYARETSNGSTRTVFLGACGAPGMISHDFGFPSDPSCFALDDKGESIVYYHNPNQCGAGSKAKAKPGGIYIHSIEKGDRLIYPARLVNQTWSNQQNGNNAILFSWNSNTPSTGGARCGQEVVLDTQGNETVSGAIGKTCF